MKASLGAFSFKLCPFPKYLYIRGGPFSVRIRYENITKIKKKKKQVKL